MASDGGGPTGSQREAAAPLDGTFRPIRSVEELVHHLRWALTLELTTIPPYLCALYSITDLASQAAAAIRDVVIEEMLHMASVANLLNAIGAYPSLSADRIPSYPTFLHHAANAPFIQLQAASAELAETVFMAVERPEPSPRVPAEGDRFHTIGQFYKAVEEGFERCVARDPHLFENDTGCQHTDVYFGGGGGRLRRVHDLPSAKQAITEIVQQGEGATYPQPPLPGEEPYGERDYFGERLDGTYGPILGTPWELSHYRRFQQIATCETPLPPVYPMQANPSAEDLDGPAERLSILFDGCYALVLTSLQETFTSTEATAFFGRSFGLMESDLPHLARLLMQIPLHKGADPGLGPNAGPAFEYRALPVAVLLGEAAWLADHCPDLGARFAAGWRATLERVVATLARLGPAGT